MKKRVRAGTDGAEAPAPGPASKLELLRRTRKRGSLIDAHTHVGIDVRAFYGNDFPYCLCADDLMVRLDVNKLDVAVCFPMVHSEYFVPRHAPDGRVRRNTRSTGPFPYMVENEHLCHEIYDIFPDCAGRLLPFACFDPGRRPQEQAAFIEELSGRYPLFGLKTATSYLQSSVTRLLDKGRSLLDVAARLDIPVTLHTAVLPADPWANVFDALDVAAARPDVRFALAHTCRFDRRALDRADELPNTFVDLSAFHIHCLLAQQEHPCVAAGRDRFPADYGNPLATMQAIAEAYPATIIWGTDTPAHYWVSRFVDDQGVEMRAHLPCGPYTETRVLYMLPPALRKRIAHDNICRFLVGHGARSGQRAGSSRATGHGSRPAPA